MMMSLRLRSAHTTMRNRSCRSSVPAAALAFLCAISCVGASSLSPFQLSSWSSPQQQQQQQPYQLIQAVRGGAGKNTVSLRFTVSVPNAKGPASVVAVGDHPQLGSWSPTLLQRASCDARS